MTETTEETWGCGMSGKRRAGLAAVALAVLAAPPVCGQGVWSVLEGTYFDDLENASDLEFTQAVLSDPADTSMYIPPTWKWTQPSGSGNATVEKFSRPGSATWFADVDESGTAEVIRLVQRFYPAVNMRWENDCWQYSASPSWDYPSGYPLEQTSLNCYVRPYNETNPAVGNRSRNVLMVGDIRNYTMKQEPLKDTNGGIIAKYASGDYTIAELVLDQFENQWFFASGQHYTVTWFVRALGRHLSPETTGANERLATFEIRFTYTSAGMRVYDLLGGATEALGCVEPWAPAPGGCVSGTGLRDKGGCPVRLSLENVGAGSAVPYLNDPAWNCADPAAPKGCAPYTPYSFGFAAGGVRETLDAWNPMDCTNSRFVHDGMNEALCKEVPEGIWSFQIRTAGYALADMDHKCGAAPGVLCRQALASASLFIDGLMLTPGKGFYRSPAFDSLSPLTRWTSICWKVDMNKTEAGKARTPVVFNWRTPNSLAEIAASSTAFSSRFSATITGEDYCLDLSGAQGRFFQYRADLRSWDKNPSNPPPSVNDAWPGSRADYCLLYSPQYDGTLNPRLESFTANFVPDAGRLVSKPVKPPLLRWWKTLTYAKRDGGGRVVADVLGPDGNPAVTDDGVVLANVASGVSLARLDPGRYPALRVRFTLYRDGVVAADPRILWFRLEYERMTDDCFSVNCNVIQLSRGESCHIRFCTVKEGHVELAIHDASGQLVKRLFRGELEQGVVCQKPWNGTSTGGPPPAFCEMDPNPSGTPVAPGLYFVTLMTPAGRQTARVAVAR